MTNLRKSRHGVYQLRKVVPDDLREVVGRREIIRSLGTKDPVQAKKARVVGAEVEAELAAARLKLQEEQPAKAEHGTGVDWCRSTSRTGTARIRSPSANRDSMSA